MEKLLEKLKANRLTIVTAIICLSLGAFLGWLGKPTRTIVETKTEWKEKIVYQDRVEWKERIKVEYKNQEVTQQDINSKCEEWFSESTGKLTHRKCELIASNSGSINGQGSTDSTNTGSASTNVAATNSGSTETKTTTGDLEKVRLSLLAGVSWTDLGFTSLPKLTYGASAEYRLFWRVWGGAYVFPQNKQVGLQLSLTL